MDHPSEKPKPVESTFGVLGLMVWMAALAAVAGLAGQVVRMARVEGTAGLVGGFLVAYVVYISLSVPALWRAPALVVPTTMLIGGVLWTLALQMVGHRDLRVAAAVVPIIPFLTAFLIRLIFREIGDPDDGELSPDRPSTVRSLLLRNRGLGPRSAPVKAEAGPDA